MKVVAFIEPQAPERGDGRRSVAGLAASAAAREQLGPQPGRRFGWPDGGSDEPLELRYVDIDTFEATF